MRLWLVVCVILSGVFLAVQLSNMSSCSSTYEIDAEGRLTEVRTMDTGGTSKPKIVVVEWGSELPEFAYLEAEVLPGDILTRTTTRSWIPVLDRVCMTELVLTRKGSRLLTYRQNFFFFWMVVVLVSLIPVGLWGIGALLAAAGTSKRRRHPVGDS